MSSRVGEAVGRAGVGEKVLEPAEFVELYGRSYERSTSKVEGDVPGYTVFDSIVPRRRVLVCRGGGGFG